MYDPQCGKGFQTAVAARMLVLGEDGGGAVGLWHLDRNDLIDERSGVDGFDRVLVAPHGPLVLRLPGDAVLNRAVVPNRDRHVDCRSVRSWRVRQRIPRVDVLVLGEGDALAADRGG